MKGSHTKNVKVKCFVNSLLQSNSYVVECNDESIAWIIDPGDSTQLLDYLDKNKLSLKGILVTHYHFDHIYGINTLKKKYPNLLIYASKKSEEGFLSARLNGSYYAEIPFEVDCNKMVFVKHGDSIKLWKNVFAMIYETPGHNDDCISFSIQENLFTGDAFIPNVKVHLKSKNSNKEQAYKTINWIISNFNDETIIYPGHKNNQKLMNCKLCQ